MILTTHPTWTGVFLSTTSHPLGAQPLQVGLQFADFFLSISTLMKQFYPFDFKYIFATPLLPDYI